MSATAPNPPVHVGEGVGFDVSGRFGGSVVGLGRGNGRGFGFGFGF